MLLTKLLVLSIMEMYGTFSSLHDTGSTLTTCLNSLTACGQSDNGRTIDEQSFILEIISKW